MNNTENNKDIDDDYEYSRKTYKELIDQAEEVLPALINLARESESPRVFEVMSGMLKTVADMTDKLMDLQQKKKNITAPVKNGMPALEGGATVTNNNVFIGNTADLQKMLIDQSKVIDVDPS
jgi:hypothetical protein